VCNETPNSTFVCVESVYGCPMTLECGEIGIRHIVILLPLRSLTPSYPGPNGKSRRNREKLNGGCWMGRIGEREI